MDDMDGLDFFGDMDEIDSLGDLFDFEEWFSKDALMSDAIAAASGAGGILLASAAIPKLSEMILPADMSLENKSRIRSGMGLLVAFIGGRILWRVDKRASAGFVGAVGGLALAQLIGGVANLDVGFAALPEEEALTGLMGNGETEELAQLGAAVAEASRREFAGSTTVTTEHLGYAPHLS
jgi:hypothetical protein